MIKDIIVTVPKLTLPGGVSAFWNALLPEFHKMDQVRFRSVEIGGHGKNVFGPLIDIWNLRKATKSKSDLIILNPSLGSRSFFRDAFFAKYLLRNNIPFVVFFHGWSLDFEERIDKKYISFFQSTLGKAKKIFVLSSDFESKLKAWGYQGEVVVATTTVNAQLFENQTIELENEDKQERLKILFLSRLIKGKGIYETINAFNQIQKDFKNAQLIIAGSGEELENLKPLVGQNENIVLTGHVDGQDKIDLYKECLFYCLPSYSEGLPTSVLEAMAFGKPVITTPVGGLKSFFQDNTMGFFVHPKDAVDLEAKFRILLTDHSLRKKMGDFNYQYAHQHIMSNKVAHKMLVEITPFL
jgi:glycosyltransferase involved in cell wall biosynthesis